MKKMWMLVATGLILIACTSENETARDGEVTSKLVADGSETTEPESVETNEQGSSTTLSFDKNEHHFGKVFVGTDNKHVFKVKNTGTNPLIISDASASCGCTVPKKPEKPIEPGGTGEIEVIFSPKPGQTGTQTKTVTVKSNTNPSITTLTISAEVVEAMVK
jgi:hypothetical protein